MFIVDAHVHVFPYLGGACGYKSAAAHMSLRRTREAKSKDMELILGGNIARILKIRTDIPRAPKPKLADVA